MQRKSSTRSLVVIIVLQMIVIAILMVYAFVQAGIAKEQEELAKENASKAIEQAILAESARREMEVRLEACAKKNQ